MATKTFPVTGSLYTEKFNEFLLSKTSDDGESDTYQDTIKPLFTEAFGEDNKFWDIFVNRWLFYEITAETENLQSEYIVTIFHMWSNYYKEKYKAYSKEFDYTTATTITRNKDNTGKDTATLKNESTITNDLKNVIGSTGNSKSTSGGTTTETPDLTTTEIDLPRKDTSNEYPSSKSKQSGTDRTEISNNDSIDTKNDSTETNIGTINNKATNDNTLDKVSNEKESITDNDKYLDAKEKYMNQLRNIEIEFADKFTDCFIHIFS